MKWLRKKLASWLFPDLLNREALVEELSETATKAIRLATDRPPVIIRGQVFEDNDPLYLGRLSEIGQDPVFEFFLAQVRESHMQELATLGRSNNTAVLNNLAGRLQQIEEVRFLLATRAKEYLAMEEAKRV